LDTCARNIQFWKTRIPELELQGSALNMTQLARHAICSNACKQLRAHLIERGSAEREINDALR
jgi:hypothetical protein